MIKGQRRSKKVIEGHRRSFPYTRLTFQVKKVMGGWVGWLVGCIKNAQKWGYFVTFFVRPMYAFGRPRELRYANTLIIRRMVRKFYEMV